jgi:hypothetical protein
MAWGAGDMPFPVEHEIHRRRFGRNLGVGLLLAAFVGVVFALTVVKVTRGDLDREYNHPEASSTMGANP